MGYSARASAMDAVDAVENRITDPRGTSNGWSCKGVSYFWERGREHTDGHVSGTVYRMIGNRAYRAGSVNIEPDGRVKSWPCIPGAVLAEVRAMHAAGKFSDGHRLARNLAEYTESLRARARVAWREACAADGIDPAGAFVCFSDDNPAAERYNTIMLELASPPAILV